MKTRHLIVALAAFGLAGVAQASQTDSIAVDFLLDPVTGLSVDGSSPAGTVGHWITPNSFSAHAEMSHVWADQSASARRVSFYSGELAGGAVGTQPFGNYGRSVDAVAADAPMAGVSVAPGLLHSGMSRQNTLDSAATYLDWRRAFTLDPYSSVTLSGLMTIDSSLQNAPRVGYSTSPAPLDTIANEAQIGFHDGETWRWDYGVRIVGSILNQDPRDFNAPLLGREPGPDDFAYSTDPQGHVALTIFNRSDQAMFGSFQVVLLTSMYQITSPIPEPSAWLAMLVGLAMMAWRGRRWRTAAWH